MTKAEIAAQTVWNDDDLGKLSLFIPLFNAPVEIVLFPELDQAPEVTDKMTAIVNDLLQINEDQLSRVKDLLWEECQFAFYVADYGVEPLEGESNKDANFREFGIRDAEDAFAKSNIEAINISDKFKGRYAKIMMNTGSENYISLIVKDGRIIDFDDDGTFLGWFDEDELHAHKKRQRVLGK